MYTLAILTDTFSSTFPIIMITWVSGLMEGGLKESGHK